MSREKTLLEWARDLPNYLSLPRSVKHSMGRSNTWSLEEHGASMLEAEVKKELRCPKVCDSKVELEAIMAQSKEAMKDLEPQLRKLRELQSKLEVAFLFHWHRRRQADKLLAKLNGKLRVIKLKKGGGRQQDPEAAYLAKFQAASKEEKLRMLEELKKEV